MGISTLERPQVKKQLTAINENQLTASICRESFFDFVKEFWDVVVTSKPVWNWHIPFVCDEIQEIMEGVFVGKPKKADLITNIPPGTTKSTLFSIMLPAWGWTRMPSCRFICGSYSERLSWEFSRKCRDIVRSEKYRACFPELEIADDQDTKSFWVLKTGGSRYAVGVGGSVMGQHAHCIIVDDPINPQEVLSDIRIMEVQHWMGQQLSQRKVDKALTPTFLVMQRLHQSDPTGWILESTQGKGIRHLCLPAELCSNLNPPEIKHYYVDGLLDPVRLPRQVLETAQRPDQLGDYGYASQFMQNPIPRGGGKFQTDKFQIIDRFPEKTIILNRVVPFKFKKIIRYWDKAATVKKWSKFTVGVKMGIDFEGRLYVLHVKRGKWNSHQREEEIRKQAVEDGKNCEQGIEQEPGSGGIDSAEDTVRRLQGYKVWVNRESGQGSKEQRADVFSTQVNGNNVYLLKGDWNKDYIEELKWFPFGKFSDQVDASSGAHKRLAKPKVKVGALGGSSYSTSIGVL